MDVPFQRSFFVLLVGTLIGLPAWASLALAQEKKCMACHTVERKVVGPAYRDVAIKYAGQNVTAKLATKIRQGGSGAWGVIPMPANPKVSEAEAKLLAIWVLSIK